MARFPLLAAALMAGVALSCQNQQDSTVQVTSGSAGARVTVALPLEGTLWEFIEIEGEPVVQFEFEETPQIRLTSADHTLHAWLSCNLFNGTYETEGESLRLHPAAVTWRECMQSHAQEETLRRIVQAVTSYSTEGDRLALLADGRVMAVLAPLDQK